MDIFPKMSAISEMVSVFKKGDSTEPNSYKIVIGANVLYFACL